MKDSPEGQTQYCQSCAELAAQVEVLRSAVQNNMRFLPIRHPVTEDLLSILAIPNTAADILRQRDARLLREMAEKLEDYYATGGAAIDAVMMVRKAANKLDRG